MASSGGIKAGRAFVELGVKTAALERGLKQASKKLKAFGGSIRNIGAKIAGLGAAMLAPFAAATKIFMSVGDQLGKMSARTGVAVEALSALEYAANQSGTSLETVEKGLLKMSRVINDARRGLMGAKDALAEVGLTVEQLEGMSPEDSFKLMAQKISEIEDPIKRAAAAQMLFGGAGKEMIPFLSQGADGIDALMKKAEELGLVMSKEDAAAAEVLTDSFATLWRVLKMGMVKVGAALAPMLTKITDAMVRVGAKISDWINRNRAWIVTAVQVILGVIAFGSALVGLGVGIQVAGFALAGLGAGLGVVMAVLGAILSPIALITAAIVGAGAAFLQWTETGQQMKSQAKGIFSGIKDHSLLMFGGIKDALAAGEWKLAGKIAWTGIKQPFVSGWNFLKDGFFSVKYLVTQLWADLFNGIAEKLTRFVGWFTKKFGRVIKFFNADFDLETWDKKTDDWAEKKNASRKKSADQATNARAKKFSADTRKVQAEERENRAALAKLREDARDKREAREAAVEETEAPEPTAAPEAAELPSTAKMFGAFSAAAVGRMSQQVEQKIQAEQLSALREIADNTAQEPGAVVFGA